MVLIPLEPFVSTLILIPILSACFSMHHVPYMCAIPVGQAVTANTYGSLDCLDDCSAAATCCASASASSLHHQHDQ